MRFRELAHIEESIRLLEQTGACFHKATRAIRTGRLLTPRSRAARAQ
ncbi:hypothetical protein [Burkholderia sp. BE17]|nr:hypothetical protein [Burkholderia sp. BE17]